MKMSYATSRNSFQSDFNQTRLGMAGFFVRS
jgi:hypothetical protein